MTLRASALSYDVLRELAPECDSYFCVGVQEGECLRNVLKANPRISSLVLCDTWGRHHGGTGRESHEHIDRLLSELNYGGEVTYLDGDSHVQLPKMPKEWKFELAYVDGDHITSGALQDLKDTWPHVTKHLVFHDVFMPYVQDAFRQFMDKHGDECSLRLFTGLTGTVVLTR